MNGKAFMQWFEQQVKPRWHDLNFTWIEIGDWHWRLGQFDPETLTEAVRRHKAGECYPIPNLKMIYDYAKQIKANNRPQRQRRDRTQSSGFPEAHTYIMCVAKSDNGRGCVGWFVPILLWPFKQQWTPQDYARVAEAQCIIHSRNGRAGVWKPFYNTTHGEMLTRSNRLRGIKPLDLDALRKRYKTF